VLDLLIPSEARRKLLTRFLMHPEQEYYGAQLQALVGMHPNSVHRELGRLERAGLIIAREVGRTICYRANRASPVFEELRGLLLKTVGFADLLAGALAEQSGIRWAFIYGSVAEGNEREGSDLDLMIVGEADMDALERSVNAAERSLSRPVNHMVFTEAELRERLEQDNTFLRTVLERRKIMLVGDEDELRRALA